MALWRTNGYAKTTVADICRGHECVVVLEEHSVYGGLGAAVAEIATTHARTWVCRIGVQDRFSRFCGSYGYLMNEHKLSVDAVRQQVTEFLERALPQRRAAA